MKLLSLKVEGFRGFNVSRDVDFDPQLTLVYANNSYGKTSVTEALEWVLFGETSRCRQGDRDSKPEYDGSYRNVHHAAANQHPSVSLQVRDEQGIIVTIRAVLNADESISRYIDEQLVDQWAFAAAATQAESPFILQHALKELLHAKPVDRFRKFAAILGLDELDGIYSAVEKVSNRPEAQLGDQYKTLDADARALLTRIDQDEELKAIFKQFHKYPATQTFAEVVTIAMRHVSAPADAQKPLRAQLQEARGARVARIFDGTLTIRPLEKDERSASESNRKTFVATAANIQTAAADLAASKNLATLVKQADFYDIGLQLLAESDRVCPFCSQPIDASMRTHIETTHNGLRHVSTDLQATKKKRDDFKETVETMIQMLSRYHSREFARTRPFLETKDLRKQLTAILMNDSTFVDTLVDTQTLLSAQVERTNNSYETVVKALQRLLEDIKQDAVDTDHALAAGETLIAYTGSSGETIAKLNETIDFLEEANVKFQRSVDESADTSQISLLIDILGAQDLLQRYHRVRAILDNLKDMKKVTRDYTNEKIAQKVETDLTGDVKTWYDLIRTTTDPDIHFDGFRLARTKGDGAQQRRVNIDATSYGRPLVSAVSSLSESKLNALGLCLGLARSLSKKSPFGFLVIDDPIQSWDTEHEEQFIGILRKLLDDGVQIVLLTHNHNWMREVRRGLQSRPGSYIEITSYSKDGPRFKHIPWSPPRQLLGDMEARLKADNLDSNQLRELFENLRHLVFELTAGLVRLKSGAEKPPHQFNAEKMRKALLESGVQSSTVDKIYSQFVAIDEAHHAGKDLSPHRQKIVSCMQAIHDIFPNELLNMKA